MLVLLRGHHYLCAQNKMVQKFYGPKQFVK